jgi:transposase-like protein
MSTYTDEDRAAAVTAYQQVGASEASRQTGVPVRTILDWARKAGVVAQANAEKTAEARAVAAERIANAWGDYREQEALAAGAAANRMRREALDASAEGDASLLRARVIAYGIFIDKAELLSGQVSQRIEVWSESEVDRQLRQAISDMEAVIRHGQG